MKRIVGLDLGTTSIGWALVNQAENEKEQSSIIDTGVRVNIISEDEKDAYEKGKSITTNSDRRLKRSMRRNIDRYQLRRDNLIKVFINQGWVKDKNILIETGAKSTFETYRLRAFAVKEEISLEELARVLLMINKKRGYKSNRKVNSGEEGHLLDSIDITKDLYNRGITPGEYCLELTKKGEKIPEFYASDLKEEFNRIWTFQSAFYPEYLTEDFKNQVTSNFTKALNKVFYAKYSITTAENKGKDKKLKEYEWRSQALVEQLPIEIVALVLSSISSAIASSSGYLGDISDRSKHLFFNNLTVGQYLYGELCKDPHFRTKNKVFYRQDYIEEFDKIWNKQSEYHKELNDELKEELRDRIIFYQRRLKSQKGLISFCEFEKREIEVEKDGKKTIKTVGCKVAPVSSPVFQDFRMWQKINNLRVTDRSTGDIVALAIDKKKEIADRLRYESEMSSSAILKLLFDENAKYYEMNFNKVEGNRTISDFYNKFREICTATGHDAVERTNLGIFGFHNGIKEVFDGLGFNSDILEFDSLLPKEEFERQPLFKLWHLLYSYEGDNSKTGNESLIKKIGEICRMPAEYASILSGITFKQDYGSLSHKAMRKILPFMMEGDEYSVACEKAGYRHSAKSLTKEEIDNRELKSKLDLLPLNSLRNPVVEKILNQLINLINSIVEKYGKVDEIHIELARELKSSQNDRKQAIDSIRRNNERNAEIEKKLKASPFNLSYVSKNDIVRYKLYEELESNGYKTLYSNQYIQKDQLFTKEIDIEHIIPQAVLFNDSFSNKTLEYRSVNLEKDKDTAIDYVRKKYGEEGYREYAKRVEEAFKNGKISKAKRNNLFRDSNHIPEDFINRDLKDTQYISKKAKELLEEYVKVVVVTTGSITSKLREDWGLVNVMKELNVPKYSKLGLTKNMTDREGRNIIKIDNWTKRNDHRHHAMDAITIAFTKLSHIQYLNNLNAKSNKSSSIYAIGAKETYISGTKRLFKPPFEINDLRASVKNQLENILISNKAKNKVMTLNTNAIKVRGKKIEQKCMTPRGALHEESVYGLRKRYETYEVAVGSKLDKKQIDEVASKEERKALMKRLEEFGGNVKKAFTGKNSPENNPIWIDTIHSRQVGSKVKCVRWQYYYTIKKDINKDLNIDKVVDSKIKRLLETRLSEKGNDKSKAFANLDADPIWINKEKGIRIKRVAIAENFNLNAVRLKKDHCGNVILDRSGKPVSADYINFKNNHHVAIYRDDNGDIKENIVPFYEAVNRVNAGQPIVDKFFKKDEGWEFMFTMKRNEMFVFPNEEVGFDPKDIDLKDPKNYSLISPNLFRVQTLSSKDYRFRHHLDTTTEYENDLRDINWKRIQNTNGLRGIVKVRINHLGEIVSVGEYD